MSVCRRESLQLFADYHQFYVQDGGINPPAPEDWSEEDVERRCKVANNVVVVCPLRPMTVPVEVVLHKEEPSSSPSEADHIVECSLAVPTGRLQVHECTGGPVLNWQVAPGVLRVRLSYFNLGTIDDTGLQGDDRYMVELWPGPPASLELVKSWHGTSEA